MHLEMNSDRNGMKQYILFVVLLFMSSMNQTVVYSIVPTTVAASIHFDKPMAGEHTVNLVSHVHEHTKLWASIAPLVQQLRQWHSHIRVSNDLR